MTNSERDALLKLLIIAKEELENNSFKLNGNEINEALNERQIENINSLVAYLCMVD